MKVKLFEGFMPEAIEVTINTNAERNILIGCIFGDRFKDVVVGGCRFIRSKNNTDNIELHYGYCDEIGLGDLSYVTIPKDCLACELREIKSYELDYNDAGIYSADAYDGTWHTTILINGVHHAVVMPQDTTEKNFALQDMCNISGLGVGTVISQAMDEAAFYVYNTRIRMDDGMEIMYEHDFDNIHASDIYEI